MVKKFLTLFVVSLLSVITLTGCEPYSINTVNCNFVPLTKDDADHIVIFYHQQTGVCYCAVFSGTTNYSYTGFTVMLKADGTPYTVEDYMQGVYELED